LRDGDILLFRGASGISKIIAWGTNSKYSHVAVCVSFKMHLAIESIAGGGVRARDVRAITEKYDVYRIKKKNAYDLNGTISYLVKKLNAKYDTWGVLWLGILKLASKIGHPLKNQANKWQKKRDYFCSELCYEAFYFGGRFDIVPNVDTADITSPADISRSPLLKCVHRAG